MISTFTQRRVLRIYEETWDLMQELEIHRDYPNEGDPHFSKEEEQTLEGLYNIWETIRKMPFFKEEPAFSDLLEYLDFEDMTWKEVAEKTGVDKGNISRQYWNRHKNLNEILEKLGLEFVIRPKN